MTKLIALTALLIVVLAAPAMACKEVRDPSAAITICGDPRAIISLDNGASNVAVQFRIIFWDAKTDIRRKIIRQVGPNDGKVLVRWVHGGNRNVAVYDAVTNEVLARVNVARAHIGPCPAVPTA